MSTTTLPTPITPPAAPAGGSTGPRAARDSATTGSAPVSPPQQWRARLEAAQTRALAARPQDSQRIALGALLALQGAVEKMASGHYAVQSQHDDDRVYDVAQSVCHCEDYRRHATHDTAYA